MRRSRPAGHRAVGHRAAAAALAASLAALAAPLAAADPEPPAPIVLERGTATLDAEGRSAVVVFWTTPAGPLFAMAPFVTHLGGELTVGPLGASHDLEVAGSHFIFGPGSPAVAVDESIERLSQPPVVAPEGLLVPLDLLRRIYTGGAGYDLQWDSGSRRLTAARRARGEIGVTVDAVHLQGVTTVVLQFDTVPRYRVLESGREVRVEILGDELAARDRRPVSAPRLAGVDVGRREIVLRLEPGSVAEEYALEEPFRLVFEIFARPAAPMIAAPPPAPVRPTPEVDTIVLDAGHGGGDTGAIGPGGALEKDLTLALTRRLAAALRARLPVRVVLTRDEDAELPLATRAALANQVKADLFLSLHLNSSYGRSARGTETYFLSLEASDERAAAAAEDANRAGGADPLSDLQLILWDMAQTRHLAASQELANLIQEELNQALGLRDRGVKQAPFTVLMGAAMPAVLVELGFLSNPDEEARLADPAHQAALVDALVRAITRFRALRQPPQPVAGAEPR